MPRTKLQQLTEELKRPPIPEGQYLAELFRRYLKAYGMTLEDVAKAYGCSQPNISAMMARPTALWRWGEILKFSSIVHCPIEEALKALRLNL